MQTEFAAPREFDSVRVEARDGPTPIQTVNLATSDVDAWDRVVRVAELPGLVPGGYTFSVSLRRNDTEVIARTVQSDVSGVRLVTVALTRDCQDVVCPGPADPETASACFAGTCVPEECTAETPEMCAMTECMADPDCAARSPCEPSRCVLGACLSSPLDALCLPEETCVPRSGCAASCTDRDAFDVVLSNPGSVV